MRLQSKGFEDYRVDSGNTILFALFGSSQHFVRLQSIMLWLYSAPSWSSVLALIAQVLYLTVMMGVISELWSPVAFLLLVLVTLPSIMLLNTIILKLLIFSF